MDLWRIDALCGLAAFLEVPIIGMAPYGTDWKIDELVGNISPISYLQSPSSHFHNLETYGGRLSHFVERSITWINYKWRHVEKQKALYKKYLPNIANKHTLAETSRNFALVLVNQHFTLAPPRPYVPNMIEVGGMHVDPDPKPLPKELEAFIQGAGDAGVIYFSLGTNVKSKSLSEDRRKLMLNTFSHLPQRVLWKFENGQLPVRLFITHGGLLSTIESIHHEKSFEVMAKITGARYRDKPMKPLETAIWWTHYVLRHNGAAHMRVAGRELDFFIYHSLDVLATFFLAFFLRREGLDLDRCVVKFRKLLERKDDNSLKTERSFNILYDLTEWIMHQYSMLSGLRTGPGHEVLEVEYVVSSPERHIQFTVRVSVLLVAMEELSVASLHGLHCYFRDEHSTSPVVATELLSFMLHVSKRSHGQLPYMAVLVHVMSPPTPSAHLNQLEVQQQKVHDRFKLVHASLMQYIQKAEQLKGYRQRFDDQLAQFEELLKQTAHTGFAGESGSNQQAMQNSSAKVVNSWEPPRYYRHLEFDAIGYELEPSIRTELSDFMTQILRNHRHGKVDKLMMELRCRLKSINVDYFDVRKFDMVNMLVEPNAVPNRRRCSSAGKSVCSTRELYQWLINDFTNLRGRGLGDDYLDFEFVYRDSMAMQHRIHLSVFHIFGSESRPDLVDFFRSLPQSRLNGSTLLNDCLKESFDLKSLQPAVVIVELPIAPDLSDARRKILKLADLAFGSLQKVRKVMTISQTISQSTINLGKLNRKIGTEIHSSVRSVPDVSLSHLRRTAKFSDEDYNGMAYWYGRIDSKFAELKLAMEQHFVELYRRKSLDLRSEIRSINQDLSEENDQSGGDGARPPRAALQLDSTRKVYSVLKKEFKRLEVEAEKTTYASTLKVYISTKNYELSEAEKSLKLREIENLRLGLIQYINTADSSISGD
ncbi:hypothetical protein M5D96_000176 [Drosophila gunungcola]|uniref:Uncharacterized protein n=1 Tax=Drosophila gunungcola TaxID=103775 RepID=A0A9Q0BTD7_9MUSC|nr:hypothetical protein M5D96_000176 [Drosophila gunungcola]